MTEEERIQKFLDAYQAFQSRMAIETGVQLGASIQRVPLIRDGRHGEEQYAVLTPVLLPNWEESISS